MAQKTSHQNQMMFSLRGGRDQRNVTIIKTDFSSTDLHWQKTSLHFRKQQQDDNFCIHVSWNCFIRIWPLVLSKKVLVN